MGAAYTKPKEVESVRQADAAHVRVGEEVGLGRRGVDDGRQGGVLGRERGGRREVGLLSRWSPRVTRNTSYP